jgi:hypothetical protein
MSTPTDNDTASRLDALEARGDRLTDRVDELAGQLARMGAEIITGRLVVTGDQATATITPDTIIVRTVDGDVDNGTSEVRLYVDDIGAALALHAGWHTERNSYATIAVEAGDPEGDSVGLGHPMAVVVCSDGGGHGRRVELDNRFDGSCSMWWPATATMAS